MQSNKYSQVIQQLRNVIAQNGLTKTEVLDLIKLWKGVEEDLDYDYLMAVLFPELHPPSRVPSRFSVPSAIFTHKFSYYQSTNDNGNGFLVFLPQDTAFCCLYRNETAYVGNPDNQFITSINYVPESDSRYITANYSQVRLIGASIRASYTGVADQESGFLNCAHVYESEIGRVSEEIIDNGYFSVKSRPHQGVRLVWVPRDNSDQEFFDSNFKIVDSNSGANTNILTANHVHNTNGDLVVQTYVGSVWVDSAAEKPILPSGIWGIGAKKLQATQPTQLMISWRGMPTAKEWIRIDVERHFEGIPRTIIRDIVSVSKPKSSEKTLDVLKRLADYPPLFGVQNIQFQDLYKQFRTGLADKLTQMVKSDQMDIDVFNLPTELGDKIGGYQLPLKGVAQGQPFINVGDEAMLDRSFNF